MMSRHAFGCFGNSSPMVSFRESAPLVTREGNGPAERLGRAGHAHAVVEADGPTRTQIGNPGGVYLPPLVALHYGDGTQWAASHRDQFLERTVERRITSRGRPLRIVDDGHGSPGRKDRGYHHNHQGQRRSLQPFGLSRGFAVVRSVVARNKLAPEGRILQG